MTNALISLQPYPAMKGSGVEWLGDVPVHWDVKRLKYLIRIRNGQDYKHVETTKGFPVIGSGGQFTYASKFLYDGESVLFGRKGTVNKPLYINSAFWTVDTMFYSEVSRSVSAKFLYYCALGFPYDYYSTQTALPSITQNDLSNHFVAIPHLVEQAAIVRYLDRVDRRVRRFVRAKQRLIELLEEQKQTIIHNAVTRGLDPDVPLKDSGVEWLGEVPEHWEVKRVKTLFRLRIEKSGVDHGKELLSIYTHIGVRPRKDLKEKGNKASTTNDYWIVRKGDLISNKLLAWMGAIGVSHFDGVTSPAYDILMPVVDMFSDYFHHLFRTKLCLQQFKQKSKGIMDMRLRLYFDQFGTIRVPVPPPEEQQAIVNFNNKSTVDADRTIDCARREISLLLEYNTRLIADVVTGKLDVREVAAQLPTEDEGPEPFEEMSVRTDGEGNSKFLEAFEV